MKKNRRKSDEENVCRACQIRRRKDFTISLLETRHGMRRTWKATFPQKAQRVANGNVERRIPTPRNVHCICLLVPWLPFAPSKWLFVLVDQPSSGSATKKDPRSG
jgi:hypothetical protein